MPLVLAGTGLLGPNHELERLKEPRGMITGDRTRRDGSAEVGKPDDPMLILR